MIRILIHTLKVLGWSVAGIVLTLLLAFLYYDVTEFQPRKDEIEQLIANAHSDERKPPTTLGRLLLTEHHDDLSMQASRLLLFNLNVPQKWPDGVNRHLQGALWWLLVRLHLSKDDQLTIICSGTFLGRRSYGFEAGAHTYFERPLGALSDKELATLVIIRRWPARWSKPERREDVAAAADSLLARAYAAERASH